MSRNTDLSFWASKRVRIQDEISDFSNSVKKNAGLSMSIAYVRKAIQNDSLKKELVKFKGHFSEHFNPRPTLTQKQRLVDSQPNKVNKKSSPRSVIKKQEQIIKKAQQEIKFNQEIIGQIKQYQQTGNDPIRRALEPKLQKMNPQDRKDSERYLTPEYRIMILEENIKFQNSIIGKAQVQIGYARRIINREKKAKKHSLTKYLRN